MARKFIMIISLLLLAASIASAQDAEPFTLTIMHTNDTHSFHEPNSAGDGGVARQATVVNQIRAAVENSLLVDAGDRFTGTLYHQQYRGEDQILLMNALGYDAMTLGNHEFDDGEAVLLNFLEGLEFPVVTANVGFDEFPEIDAIVAPYTVLEVGGQQIGIIGLTTPTTTFSSSPSDLVVFDKDMLGAVERVVSELTEQGVNKIILVTHTGLRDDLVLLPELEGVDVFVGGHSHTLFSTAYRRAGDNLYPLMGETNAGEPIYYVQAGDNTQYLGRLDVTFDADGIITAATGDTIFLSRYIAPDPDIQAIMDGLAGPVNELRAQPIGAEATELLVGNRAVCRVEECALGNLITDALRAETGSQIAITNGGGIRADIDAGEITVGDVLTVLPFGNLVSTMQLSGADVIAALENGVSTVQVVDGNVTRDGAGGRFPQVSGLRFIYNPMKDAGERVISVEVQGEDGTFAPIDPEAMYSVSTNNFMRTGGDEYDVFAENAVEPYDFGKPLDQALAEYLVTLGTVSPSIEGRIVIEGAELPPVE